MVNTEIRLITFFAAEDGEALDSQQKKKKKKKEKKIKKVGKSTRPFRYDLHQTPYDCTVEVTNRFNGLNLIDRMPKEL